MTKEIIIDGVNVAGCGYYNQKNDKGEWCDLTCERESATGFRCETMPNCYYKQLKRLEQENHLLKQTLKDKNFVEIVEENEKLLHTLQEIKEIAEQILNKNEFVYMNYRDVRQIIRLITKAEEE